MDGNEFCGQDTILCGNTHIVDDKCFSYSISDVNCTTSDLNFFESADNKTAHDFIYYDWPEIGNFEDVDKIFRSCDSTFGLGVSEEDELGWLSSADDLGLGGSDVKFLCPEPNVAERMTQNKASMEGCSINDSVIRTVPTRSSDSSWTSEEAFVIESDTVDCKDEFIPHEQVNEHKKYIKLQNQSHGEGKGYDIHNVSFNCGEELPNEVMQPPEYSYQRPFSYVHMQHPSQCLKYNYLQNPASNEQSDNSHLSDLASGNLKSSTAKSKNIGLSSLLQRDSFSTHSQVQYMESSSDNSPFEVSALAMSGQREKRQIYQDNRSVNSSIRDEMMGGIFEPGSVRKHSNYGDPEGISLASPAELGSFNVQESFTLSSGRDDLSLEAASFRQLQLVTEELDLQTKLCIRDGLYRLAKNANKRRNPTNRSIRHGDGRELTGTVPVPGETKIFTDVETGTNPIDRSIAHLLFHQLPDSSSTTPAHKSFPSMLHRSVASEETVSEA